MSQSKKVLYVLATLAGLILVPYVGGWLHVDGHFPTDYFNFPALVAPPKAPFSLPVFITVALIFGAVLLLYVVPGLFGFKKSDPAPRPTLKKVALPIWFWIGLLLWGGTLFVLWGKFSEPRWLINWAVLPLFWGFTLLIDGWVYVRNGGRSLLSQSLQEVIGIGVASISGWLIFEYLNFFVDDNWTYPFGNLIAEDEFVIYAVVGSSGLMPMSLEWYCLLRTSSFFRHRFDRGPVVHLPAWVGTLLLLIFFAALFAISFYPSLLFGFLWVAPLGILLVVLSKLNIWTPLTPIKTGNWTPALLLALTYLIQGLLAECWNYFSGYHDPDGTIHTHNPDYWAYSLPYVNVLHLFEMPLLGFLGYMPFGLYCAVWWITFAFLLNIPSRFPATDPTDDTLTRS